VAAPPARQQKEQQLGNNGNKGPGGEVYIRRVRKPPERQAKVKKDATQNQLEHERMESYVTYIYVDIQIVGWDGSCFAFTHWNKHFGAWQTSKHR
jgi:transcription initiation factor TFIID subunit TAF12